MQKTQKTFRLDAESLVHIINVLTEHNLSSESTALRKIIHDHENGIGSKSLADIDLIVKKLSYLDQEIEIILHILNTIVAPMNMKEAHFADRFPTPVYDQCRNHVYENRRKARTIQSNQMGKQEVSNKEKK